MGTASHLEGLVLAHGGGHDVFYVLQSPLKIWQSALVLASDKVVILWKNRPVIRILSVHCPEIWVVLLKLVVIVRKFDPLLLPLNPLKPHFLALIEVFHLNYFSMNSFFLRV